jgi:zinc transport system substrate-binding protein
MKLKKIILIIVVIIFVLLIVCAIILKKHEKIENKNGKLNVVVTSFSAYDFVRQIAGDKVNLTFLLGPGVDAHGYDPTASDLIKIQKSDIFVYIGGEMEKWTPKVLSNLDTKNTKVVCIADSIQKIDEQEIDGAEPEQEDKQEQVGSFDEHIWTSPANAMKMVEYLANMLCENDSVNKELYLSNASNYINEIKEVQSEIQKIVDNKVRDRLVFGDKMPMQYFLNEYGLKASAAFSGCSTETEPSSSTIAYLVNKVKQDKIPVVLYIEMSSGKVAKTIAEETGAEAVQIQSLHNVSKTDFENGETYVSLMTRNLDVLKKSLQ